MELCSHVPCPTRQPHFSARCTESEDWLRHGPRPLGLSVSLESTDAGREARARHDVRSPHWHPWGRKMPRSFSERPTAEVSSPFSTGRPALSPGLTQSSQASAPHHRQPVPPLQAGPGPASCSLRAGGLFTCGVARSGYGRVSHPQVPPWELANSFVCGCGCWVGGAPCTAGGVPAAPTSLPKTLLAQL